MKRRILVFCLILCMSIGAYSQTSEANGILGKVVNLIKNSKGTTAKFTLYNSGFSGSGEIKTAEEKFNVRFPDIEVWYNGKDLYTFNKGTQETTLVNPTPEELSESNPLAYVTGASKNYDVTFSTVKKSGKDVLELTPKKKGEIKRITLTVNKTTFAPEKIVVEPAHGQPVTAEISYFKTGLTHGAVEFEYPESKLSNVEIIDLR